MKKLLLETSFRKIYMIIMILISLLVIGGYFSYAMFTVTKEKSNAISIVTGNLTYELLVDGEKSNILSVSANSSKEFVVTVSNPNNRIARFNFYYIGNIASDVEVGYVKEEGISIPPVEIGINLEKIDTAGSSNTYKIRVNNTSSNSVTITLGISVGLDYNDLALPSDGHLFKEYEGVELYKVLLKDSKNNINTSDSEQTFITGENPNNYIWYSGKLWRAVSIDPADNSVKLVTQWNISSIPFSREEIPFDNSYAEMLLNDMSVDGFLSNLRDYESFIKTDSIWNATMTTSTDKPPKTTIVENPVGLLNAYEYTKSYTGTTYSKGYLNNGLWWFLITSYDKTRIRGVDKSGSIVEDFNFNSGGIRPSINLKPKIKTVDGKGTEEDPYRLAGDNDKSLFGTLVSSRYSGEYITFGTGENTLYRIVSHETEGQTKITSAEPLKENSKFKTSTFGSNTTFSSSNTIGEFLNNDYLNNGTYLTSEQKSIIEDNTTWYLGTVADGQHYRLAKYKDYTMSETTSEKTIAKVGLLRLGELMSGQFTKSNKSKEYFTLTPHSQWMKYIYIDSDANELSPTSASGIKPAFNLKANVIITSGDGTKNNPFEINLSS